MPRGRTRKKVGGRIIGQGAYGCVYQPALACEGNIVTRDGQVSKLVSKKNMDEEYASHDILRNIDPGRELYAYPLEKCDFKAHIQDQNTRNTLLTPSEKQNLARNPLIEFFPNHQRINASKVKYRRKGKCAITNADQGAIIQMADAGSTYNELSLTKSDVYGFFQGFENILQAVKTLHEAGYFHHDIKPVNILIQKKGQGFKFRLADFGSMRSLSKSLELYKKGEKVNNTYHSPYPYWPLYTVFLHYDTRPIVHLLNGISKHGKYLVLEEKNEIDKVINFNSTLASELAGYHVAEPAYSIFKNGNRQSIDDLDVIMNNVYRIFYEKVEKGVGLNSDNSFTNFLQNIDIYSLALTLNLYVNSIFNSICIFNNDRFSFSITYKHKNRYVYFSDYYTLLIKNGYNGYAAWLEKFTTDVVISLYNIVIKFMNTKKLYKLLSIDKFIGDYRAVLEKFKNILDNDTNNYYSTFMKMVTPTLIKPTPSPLVQASALAQVQPIYSPNVSPNKTKKRERNNQPPANVKNQKIQKTYMTPSQNKQEQEQGQSVKENEPFFATNSMQGQ